MSFLKKVKKVSINMMNEAKKAGENYQAYDKKRMDNKLEKLDKNLKITKKQAEYESAKIELEDIKQKRKDTRYGSMGFGKF